MKKLLGLTLSVVMLAAILPVLTGCPGPVPPVTVARPPTRSEAPVRNELHIHVLKWSDAEGDSNGRKMQNALAGWFRDNPDLELMEMVSDNASGELVLVAIGR